MLTGAENRHPLVFASDLSMVVVAPYLSLYAFWASRQIPGHQELLSLLLFGKSSLTISITEALYHLAT